MGDRDPNKTPEGTINKTFSKEKSPNEGLKKTSTVRRSIGEWEAGKQEQNMSQTKSQPLPKILPTAPSTLTSATFPAASATLPTSPSLIEPHKPRDRLSEARACLLKVKAQLGLTKNTKTEIKTEVLKAVERLYQLVKEAEKEKGTVSKKTISRDTAEATDGRDPEAITWLRPALEEQAQLVKEGNRMIKQLRVDIEKQRESQEARDSGRRDDEEVIKEIRGLRETTQEMGKQVTAMKGLAPTFAEALSVPQKTWAEKPKHSIIVSSDVIMDTGAEVIGRVREVLDAKKSGIQIDRVRKVKDRRVILSFSSKEELERTTTKLKRDKNLKVEEAKNRSPLIIIKDLLSYNTDEDILTALKTQNTRLLGDLTADEAVATVKYRRRARNSLESHVILQVTPKMWQRLTSAGRVFIDLQSVKVHDQTPLIQCTKCLAYGHGRKLCTESINLCTYCGGPHLKSDCPRVAVGDLPTCKNCIREKISDIGHTVYSEECSVRKKWDALARAATAYC